MPIRLTIDNGLGPEDYTQYLLPGSLVIEDSINVPTLTSFTLIGRGSAFTVPARSAYVQVYDTKFNLYLATGFVTNTPSPDFVGRSPASPATKFQLYQYVVQVTSDEYLLNHKAPPYPLTMVNQTVGQILANLAEALAPGFFDVSTNVDAGDLIPIFQYDPQRSWSDVAKDLCDTSRYRYKVINRTLYFKPYGDELLPLSYDDTLGERNFAFPGIQTAVQNLPLVNDAIVFGKVEAQRNREDYLIGDGVTGAFALRHAIYQGSSASLLSEDWTTNAPAAGTWRTQDPEGAIFVFDGSLNINGGLGIGQTFLAAQNGVELGGQNYIQHGEVTFDGLCKGLIGGLYTTSTLEAGSCLAGFSITGDNVTVVITASGASGLQLRPFFSGAQVGPTITTRVNHRYVLQTLVNSRDWARWNATYRTLAGAPFGGAARSSLGDITWTITDIDQGDTAHPVITRYTMNDVVLPPFAVYGLLNAETMTLHLNYTQISNPPQANLYVRSLYGPTGTQLPVNPPGPVVPYPLGFGMQGQVATIGRGGDTDSLAFYTDTIPAVGSRIRLQSWDSGLSVGRVRDTDSVATEAAKVGDDGVRSATLMDLRPPPRTSEECELAAAAAIMDRVGTRYQGSYSFPSDFLQLTASKAGAGAISDFPRSGRYLSVNSPGRDILNQAFLVQSVRTVVVEPRESRLHFTLAFGPDLYLERLLMKFIERSEGVLVGQNTGQPLSPIALGDIATAYLPTLTDAVLSNIAGATVDVDLGVSPLYTVEVRKVDQGWGKSAVGLIGTYNTRTFTLTRTNVDETYYIRYAQDGKTSRFSKALRVSYPMVPSAPILANIISTDVLNPTIQLSLAGDIRNICGIEIRASDNSTVLVRKRFISASDLVNAVPNQGAQLVPQYYCYFFNLMWEYSSPLLVSFQSPPYSVDVGEGASLVRNPGFEAYSVQFQSGLAPAAGQYISNTWVAESGGSSAFYLGVTGGLQNTGQSCGVMELQTNQIIAASGGSVSAAITAPFPADKSKCYPVRGGDIYYFGGYLKWLGTAFPAGVNGELRFQVQFFTASGGLVSTIQTAAATSPSAIYQHIDGMAAVPSAAAFMTFRCFAKVTNTNPTQFDTSTTKYLTALFDDVFLLKANKGAHSSYRPLSNPLTAEDVGGGFARVNIATFVMQSGMSSVQILAGTITGLLNLGVYYIYYVDPAFAGGSVTFLASTTKEDAFGREDRFFVGSIITPAASGAMTYGNNDGGAGAQIGMTNRYQFAVLAQSVSGSGSVADLANASDADPDSYTTMSIAPSGGTVEIRGTNTPALVARRYQRITGRIVFSIPTFDSRDGGGTYQGQAQGIYTEDGGSTWNTFGSLFIGPFTQSKQVLEFGFNTYLNPLRLGLGFTASAVAAPLGSTVIRIYDMRIDGDD